jgi:hypothetical protein
MGRMGTRSREENMRVPSRAEKKISTRLDSFRDFR